MRIRSAVDGPALRRAFQRLIDRHPALRTTFPTVDGEPRQPIAPRAEVCFREVDASGLNDQSVRDRVGEEARRPFDLDLGPLLRVTLFSRPDRDSALVLVMHHIVTDFWSSVVFLQELGECYRAERAPRLAPAPGFGTPITSSGRGDGRAGRRAPRGLLAETTRRHAARPEPPNGPPPPIL